MPDRTAQARGVESFYTDLSADPRQVRVCRGLSCELAGAGALRERLASEYPCRDVYCLGYCDRSPALLTPDGGARVGTRGTAPPFAAPSPAAKLRVDIRCVSHVPVITARIVNGSHAPISRAQSGGVYEVLGQALQNPPQVILDVVERSGQQGRGGAGFPTGRKWRLCAEAHGARRYVVANGDEGDPGSFIDRVLLEDDPHAVIEGLILCAYAVGAHEGVVYIRSEYPQARQCMQQAIIEAREAGILGAAVLGSPFAFDLRVVSGHGSYVCGEETALLNAIEGRRGEVRVRPPYPAQSGLYAQPTVVNNIETLVNIPWILRHGAAAFRQLGTAASPGTKAYCLNHGFARPGIVEAEFGLTLRELIAQHGGGGAAGAELAAVVLGGPMGSVVPPADWDVVLDFPALAAKGIQLGHGGLVAIPRGTDLCAVLVHWLQFMADESCGKCVPCRDGSRRALGMARDIGAGRAPAAEAEELSGLLDVIEATSLCGFGQGIPPAVKSLLAIAGLASSHRQGSQ
jgi:NADH:ubiquinone oxidoreductase subunit F (NADH-binding)